MCIHDVLALWRIISIEALGPELSGFHWKRVYSLKFIDQAVTAQGCVKEFAHALGRKEKEGEDSANSFHLLL